MNIFEDPPILIFIPNRIKLRTDNLIIMNEADRYIPNYISLAWGHRKRLNGILNGYFFSL